MSSLFYDTRMMGGGRLRCMVAMAALGWSQAIISSSVDSIEM